MEKGFGGPVWHASARGRNIKDSEKLADQALVGVGDSSIGEWREVGSGGTGVFHVRRRLTLKEQEDFSILEVRDIRGTHEESVRFKMLLLGAPHLASILRNP